jgi:hypothetical protein
MHFSIDFIVLRIQETEILNLRGENCIPSTFAVKKQCNLHNERVLKYIGPYAAQCANLHVRDKGSFLGPGLDC